MSQKNITNRPKPAAGKVQPNKGSSKTSTAQTKKETSWMGFLFNPYNLLFGGLTLLFLFWLNTSNQGYNWVHNTLLKEGYKACVKVEKIIDKRTQGVQSQSQKEQIARDTKYEVKLGADFLVLKYIRDQTPSNAIILFPPADILTKKTDYVTLRHDFCLKAFPSYFLYPRKVVYEGEKGKNPLFEKAQYVFALHGWGYQYLKYAYEPSYGLEILPIESKP